MITTGSRPFHLGHTAQKIICGGMMVTGSYQITNSAVILGQAVIPRGGPGWITDNDGYIDLFVCNSAPYKKSFMEQRDATFTKVTNSVLTSMIIYARLCLG